MTDANRIQITVALIGVGGVIAAAAISNWDKIFGSDAPVAARTAPPPEQTSNEAIQVAQRSQTSRGAVAPPASSSVAFALRIYLYPRDRTLWNARRVAALEVMQQLDLLPRAGISQPARLVHILSDGDREQERRALVQGLIASPNVDEAARAELREALGN